MLITLIESPSQTYYKVKVEFIRFNMAILNVITGLEEIRGLLQFSAYTYL